MAQVHNLFHDNGIHVVYTFVVSSIESDNCSDALMNRNYLILQQNFVPVFHYQNSCVIILNITEICLVPTRPGKNTSELSNLMPFNVFYL